MTDHDAERSNAAAEFWDWFARNGGLRGVSATIGKARQFLRYGDHPPRAPFARRGPAYRVNDPQEIYDAFRAASKKLDKPAATKSETALALDVGESTLNDALHRFGRSWPPSEWELPLGGDTSETS